MAAGRVEAWARDLDLFAKPLPEPIVRCESPSSTSTRSVASSSSSSTGRSRRPDLLPTNSHHHPGPDASGGDGVRAHRAPLPPSRRLRGSASSASSGAAGSAPRGAPPRGSARRASGSAHFDSNPTLRMSGAAPPPGGRRRTSR